MSIFNMMNIVTIFIIREMVRYYDLRERTNIENHKSQTHALRENIVK